VAGRGYALRFRGRVAYLVALLAAAPTHANNLPAKILAGRAPEAPVNCLPMDVLFNKFVYDDHVIYYRAINGKYDYIQWPPKCLGLRNDAFYKTLNDFTPPKTCAGDTIQTSDRATGLPNGVCTLDKFIPYPRKGRAQ
jgi:hypothetical protein